MARNSEMNQELRKQSEEKIIVAAMEMFASYGYAATKTTQIVKKAGISQGLLYHYFPDKKVLYEKCLNRCSHQSGIYVEKLLGGGGDAEEKIKHFTNGILEDLKKSDLILHQFILFIRVSLEEAQQELISNYESKPISLLENVIRQAQQEKTGVEGEARLLSILYWATMKGLCIHMMSKNTRYPIPEPKMLYRILLKDKALA